MNPIPSGSTVWYVSYNYPVAFTATVITSDRVEYGGGYRYTLDCPSCPFVIGFAYENEVFATAVSAAAVVNSIQLRQAILRQTVLVSQLKKTEEDIAKYRQRESIMKSKYL